MAQLGGLSLTACRIAFAFFQLLAYMKKRRTPLIALSFLLSLGSTAGFDFGIEGSAWLPDAGAATAKERAGAATAKERAGAATSRSVKTGKSSKESTTGLDAKA